MKREVSREVSSWPVAKARAWQERQSWLCGFNYVPSTAVNSTDMWQRETFDLPAIERELAWAKAIGLNACRVFLQFLVWQSDRADVIERIHQFLDVAHGNGISTMFILFDDCAFAGKEPYLGPQDEPSLGVHNSGWTASPGHSRVVNREYWPCLRDYVRDILGYFAEDERVLCWDLYNEPGNNTKEESLPLLCAAFEWAREVNPSQPLTSGVWSPDLLQHNEFVCAASDVISFHQYSTHQNLTAMIEQLRRFERPILCTEWMARQFESTFETHLPLFKEANVGCYCWGLVQGRTQTHFPWGSEPGAAEPQLWFHDILHPDGRPYRQGDIEAIRRHTGA